MTVNVGIKQAYITHIPYLPTAESETVGFLVSLKHKTANVSIAQQVQPPQWAPCYSSTNFIAASWELTCLLLTKIHHVKWNKERGDQLEDNSCSGLPTHTAASLGHRMELEGTRGRRNVQIVACCNWAGKEIQGSQCCCRKQQNKGFNPRTIKRDKQNCGKTQQKQLMCLSSLCRPQFKADGAVTSEHRLHV